jgi:serine/threonine protein kinase
MSFESPSRKEDPVSARGHYHNLSLLNYMLFKEKQRAQPTPQGPLAKDQFTVVEILGKGGFGKVYRVEQKRTRAVYAMKEMSKTVYVFPHSA